MISTVTSMSELFVMLCLQLSTEKKNNEHSYVMLFN